MNRSTSNLKGARLSINRGHRDKQNLNRAILVKFIFGSNFCVSCLELLNVKLDLFLKTFDVPSLIKAKFNIWFLKCSTKSNPIIKLCQILDSMSKVHQIPDYMYTINHFLGEEKCQNLDWKRAHCKGFFDKSKQF